MADDGSYKPPQDTRWVDIQKRTFTRWANNFLLERMMKIEDLGTDLSDGLLLVNLLEIISAKQIPQYNKKPKIRAQKLENTGACLMFLKNEGIKLVAIGPEDITDCNLKLILGLIWTIILRYQINKGTSAGGSAKNDLLQWVRSKIPECNVNDFMNSWSDGRAICHLVEALNPGEFPPGGLEQLKGKSPLDNATKGEELAEKDMGIPMILAPEDMVAAADELSCMTYISYFRDYENNEGKRRAAELAARTVDPSKTRAFGPGLERAETGIPAEFTIQAVNAAGVNIPTGGEQWEVKVNGASPSVQPKVTDNGNGTYGVVYVATVAGPHQVHVNHKGRPIQNSPWTVPVDRAPADPNQTVAYGPGLEGGVQGQPGVFTIEARDRLGQRIKTGGDPFKVTVNAPYNRDLDVNVKDNQDGTHTVTYLPIDHGKHVVQIALNGAPVAKSPYNVSISKPAGYPDQDRSFAEGPGLKGGNTAEPATFKIFARDANNNPVVLQENPFVVDIVNPDGTECAPKITNKGDGSFDVVYEPKQVGPHEVTVGLKNPAAPVYFDHLPNSPFKVNIVPGCDASKSKVYGPGIEDGVQDNLPTHFTIEAIGTNGEPMRKGGDPFEVKIAGPKGDVPAEVIDNNDGTYTVNFAPDDAGKHKIDVKLKGKDVANAPYTINVREGADHNTSVIEAFQFTIQAKTKRGANMARGGEKFTVDISGPSGKVQDVKLADNGNGTYTCIYKLPEGAKGKYNFLVTVNGKPIKGAPWTHEH